MAIIERFIAKKIGELSQTFPCVVITGARQVGKTTLLKHLFPNYSFGSLDLPSLAEKAENEPALFLKEFPEPLVVDEVQYAPGLFRHLKREIDKDRHKMGRFILTGSQKFNLMKEVSDSLAGRAAILNMETLSISEIGLPQNASWTEVLARGFYPELWRQPQLNSYDFYSSYVATYLERDVRQILNIQSLRDFERFLRACAVRSGQLLNMSDLARDVGIKAQTARDWLSVLEASNQVSLLEPYFENVGKRIVKSPKLYLNDPGMLCFLLGLDATALLSNPLVGTIWETFVYSEFRKSFSTRDPKQSVWYYRDAQGREIDFLCVGGGKIDLYEVKWTEDASQRWISSLKEAATILSKSKTQRIGESYLVTRSQETLRRDGVVVTNPVKIFERVG